MKSANLSDLCERRRRAGETGIFYDEDTPKAGYVDNGTEWGGEPFLLSFYVIYKNPSSLEPSVELTQAG